MNLRKMDLENFVSERKITGHLERKELI